MQKLHKSLIKSIYYSLLEYKYIHNKQPDCIVLNKVAYDILTLGWDLIIHNNLGLDEIYGVPVRISNDATDEGTPRFWLCEEGMVRNFEAR